MCSTFWTAQRCSQIYTEKRRGRKETEVSRKIKGGNEKERDRDERDREMRDREERERQRDKREETETDAERETDR